jgi:hypothetical protein
VSVVPDTHTSEDVSFCASGVAGGDASGVTTAELPPMAVAPPVAVVLPPTGVELALAPPELPPVAVLAMPESAGLVPLTDS